MEDPRRGAHDSGMQVGIPSRPMGLGILFPGFCGMVVAAVVLAQGRFPNPFLAALPFALVGFVAWLLARWADRNLENRFWVHILGSFLLVFVVYTGLSGVAPWLLPADREWALLSVDHVWFGYSWEGWCGKGYSPWVGDFLEAVYGTFYFFPVFLTGILVWKKDREGIFGTLDRLVLTLLLVFCGYLLVPARSPYGFMEYPGLIPSDGIQIRFHQIIVDQPWTKRDCFPSGHVLLSAYAAWLCWLRARPWAWLMVPWAVFTLVGTLYLRYHFLVDVVVSLLLLPVLAILANYLFGRMGASTRSS